MRRVGTGTAGAALSVVLAALVLAGCGRSISGTYMPANNGGMSPYQKLEFESGDTVDLATIVGITMRGTYKIDGKKVIVTISSASLVFTIDDAGCLDGGMEGKYCQK